MRDQASKQLSFIYSMQKNHVDMQYWNDIHRDTKKLKKLSNLFGFTLLTEQAAAIAIQLGIILVYIFFNTIYLKKPIGNVDFNIFSDTNSVFAKLSELYMYIGYMFIPFILIASFLKQNPFKTVPVKPIKKPAMMLPAVVITMAIYIVGNFVADFIVNLFSLVHLQPAPMPFDLPGNVPAFLLYFTSICILAPLFEEFIFRGLIMQNLRKYGNGFAVVASAMLFGLLHGNIVQIPFAFIVGLALGFFVLRFESVWAGVILHFVINTTSVVYAVLSKFLGDSKANLIYMNMIIVIFVLSFICIAVLHKTGKLNFSEMFAKQPVPGSFKMKKFVLTPGFLVFLGLIVISVVLSLRIV